MQIINGNLNKVVYGLLKLYMETYNQPEVELFNFNTIYLFSVEIYIYMLFQMQNIIIFSKTILTVIQ